MIQKFTKLYNPERKIKFLEEEYPHHLTQKTYGSILQSYAKFEEYYKKDLCDFSPAEAVDAFIGLRKKTLKSAGVAKTVAYRYVEWCKSRFSDTGFNAFALIHKEDLPKYLHQVAQKESYFTREKVFEIVDELYNPIDQALVALLFEKVKGKVDFEELRNLKKSDIFPISNTIKVTRNNGQSRRMQVSERTMDILVETINQEEYYRENGLDTATLGISKMKDTEYLLRPVDNGHSTEDRMAVSSINTRFRKIREFTGISFLSPMLVFQSGLLERCEEIYNIEGGIEPEDYRGIYEELHLEKKNWFNLKTMHESFRKNQKDMASI